MWIIVLLIMVESLKQHLNIVPWLIQLHKFDNEMPGLILSKNLWEKKCIAFISQPSDDKSLNNWGKTKVFLQNGKTFPQIPQPSSSNQEHRYISINGNSFLFTWLFFWNVLFLVGEEIIFTKRVGVVDLWICSKSEYVEFW